MLPNLWEQITHSPFSSLTLWGCHQRIVSCSGVCRREVAESCSVPFTHGFSISCHGSCNIQTASQKGEAKKGRHTPFTAPPSSPRPGPRQCNTAAAVQRRTQCQQREKQNQTPTRPWGRQWGWTSRSNRCAGVGFSRTGSVEGWHHGSQGNPESRPWNHSRGAIAAGPSAPNPEVK